MRPWHALEGEWPRPAFASHVGVAKQRRPALRDMRLLGTHGAWPGPTRGVATAACPVRENGTILLRVLAERTFR